MPVPSGWSWSADDVRQVGHRAVDIIAEYLSGLDEAALIGLVGARNSGTLRDLRIFVDHSAKSVMSDDLDVASLGSVQWS